MLLLFLTFWKFWQQNSQIFVSFIATRFTLQYVPQIIIFVYLFIVWTLSFVYSVIEDIAFNNPIDRIITNRSDFRKQKTYLWFVDGWTLKYLTMFLPNRELYEGASRHSNYINNIVSTRVDCDLLSKVSSCFYGDFYAAQVLISYSRIYPQC